MLEVGEGGFDRLRAAGVKPITAVPPELLGTFDIVTLWDVYEHVWPHDEFFKPIHAALKEDGKLIFECPKPSRLVSAYRLLGHLQPSPRRETAFWQIANYTHVQLCTPKEICSTLPHHGFEILHLETQSSLSFRGVEYAQRIFKPRALAAAIGGMFDIPFVRKILLGENKSFVVARKVDRH